MLGAAVQDAAVLDLFAGTGGLGFEALRRGARRVVFVEREARRAAAIRTRARELGVEGRTAVRREDALGALTRLAASGEAFDVVLLDPPYGQGWLARTLEMIARSGVVCPGGRVVAEGHWRDRPEPGPGQRVIREARYGETAVWVLETRAGGPQGGAVGVRIAVYPGSFDPVHLGHVEVIRRAVRLFDRVIVAVAVNVEKGSSLFSVEDRVAMLAEVAADLPTVEVAAYQGLTVDFALERGASCLIKGLRAVGDFDYELKQSAMNRRLAPSLDTLLFIADPEYAFISSSLIREVARLGGAVDSIVPPVVVRRLQGQRPPEG